MSIAQRLYRGGRPSTLARIINRGAAAVYALGIPPDYLVALEVVGRRSGRTTRPPMVLAVMDGERYLVSMLGEQAAWVRNARAAGGEAVLRHGRREEVRLEEVPAGQRAPILKSRRRTAPPPGRRYRRCGQRCDSPPPTAPAPGRVRGALRRAAR